MLGSPVAAVRLCILVFTLVSGAVQAAWALSVFDVAIDTAALTGTPAQLAFDLTSSDLATNDATITGFTTDGSLGTASTTDGPVTGALPGTTTIADTALFNELLQDLTLGNTIAFTLTLTENRTGGGLPDQFALFLLDAASGMSLVSTSDPTGANALFAVDITGAACGDLQVFSSTSRVTATTCVAAVPEPHTLLLVTTGLVGLAALRHRKHGAHEHGHRAPPSWRPIL